MYTYLCIYLIDVDIKIICTFLLLFFNQNSLCLLLINEGIVTVLVILIFTIRDTVTLQSLSMLVLA